MHLVLSAPRQLVFDFAQPPDRLVAVRAGGRPLPPAVVDGHLVVPAATTAAGDNEIEIEFVAGDEALNRNDEFLYTLFVPARAQLAFPCFDQPDLKARYTLVARRARRMAGGGQRRRGRPRTPTVGRAATRDPVRRDTAAPDVSVRVRRRKVFRRDAQRGTAASSGCSTARPMPRRSRATATRSSISTPRRSPGSRTTPPSRYPFGKFDFVADSVVSVRRHGAPRRHPLQRRRACCSTNRRRRTSCSIAPASSRTKPRTCGSAIS